MRGYLTPDTIPTTDFVCRRLVIPNDLSIVIAVNGAIDELTKAYNWEEFGVVTPDEISLAMEIMFRGYLRGEACLIGSIQLYAVDSLPSGVLACDGASHLRADYPQLYAVLPSVFITDADHFTTPDLYQGTDMKYAIVSR